MLSSRMADAKSLESIKRPYAYLVPDETSISQKTDKDGTPDPVSVKLVSPIKQVDDQVTGNQRQ